MYNLWPRPRAERRQEKETENYMIGDEDELLEPEYEKETGNEKECPEKIIDNMLRENIQETRETPKKLPSELIRMYGGIKHDFMLDGFEDNTDIRVMNHAIDEMSKRLKGVVMYLDETVMGKTVGCNECGNNIKL